MKRSIVGAMCALLVVESAVFTPAQADSLPRHAGVVHADPFIDGWPVPPIFPPPGVGEWEYGDGVDPDPEYCVVGPYTLPASEVIGFDGLESVDWWLWEHEIDLDPYLDQGATMSVALDFTLFGGPDAYFGPFETALGPGPEIWFGVAMEDMASAGEIGIVENGGGLHNLCPFPVAYGESVVETPANLPPGFVRKTVEFLDGSGVWFEYEEYTGDEWWMWGIRLDGDQVTIYQTPEPGTGSLLALALLAAIRRRRA